MKIYSEEVMLAERASKVVKQTRQARIGSQVIDVEHTMQTGMKPRSKLTQQISTMTNAQPLIVKAVMDFVNGQEEVARQYEALYSVNQDSDYGYYVGLNYILGLSFTMARKLEGAEIQLGEVTQFESDVLKLESFAALLQITREMKNSKIGGINIDRVVEEMGRASVRLLNDLAFKPLVSHTYSGANLINYVTTGDSVSENVRLSIEAGINRVHTMNNKAGVVDTILCHPADLFSIERALAGGTFNGTTFPALSIGRIIPYKGYSGTVNKKAVNYLALTPGNILIIRRDAEAFSMFIQDDGLVETGSGDFSRAVDEEIRIITTANIVANVADHSAKVKIA